MLLKKRSYEPEMLDLAETDDAALRQNLRELQLINRFLGGFRTSRTGLRRILRKSHRIGKIVDIGCGGGDFLAIIAREVPPGTAEIVGVDKKEQCVRYSLEHPGKKDGVEVICADYQDLPSDFLQPSDIIHCSLFLHHLTDDQILDLFSRARQTGCMLLINDLHRHYLALAGIKIITRLFLFSPMVKNDAPLSVKRGFTRTELEILLKKAGYTRYTIDWLFPFRYLVIAWP